MVKKRYMELIRIEDCENQIFYKLKTVLKNSLLVKKKEKMGGGRK